jgi:hypothetical protein
VYAERNPENPEEQGEEGEGTSQGDNLMMRKMRLVRVRPPPRAPWTGWHCIQGPCRSLNASRSKASRTGRAPRREPIQGEREPGGSAPGGAWQAPPLRRGPGRTFAATAC